MWTDRLVSISIPAARKADAEAVLVALGNGPGPALPCAVSPTGNSPATHYVASGYVFADTHKLLPMRTVMRVSDAQGNVTVQLGTAQSVRPADVLAAAAEMKVAGLTLAKVVTLLASIDVGDDEWQSHLARKALQRIPDKEVL